MTSWCSYSIYLHSIIALYKLIDIIKGKHNFIFGTYQSIQEFQLNSIIPYNLNI